MLHFVTILVLYCLLVVKIRISLFLKSKGWPNSKGSFRPRVNFEQKLINSANHLIDLSLIYKFRFFLNTCWLVDYVSFVYYPDADKNTGMKVASQFFSNDIQLLVFLGCLEIAIQLIWMMWSFLLIIKSLMATHRICGGPLGFYFVKTVLVDK